MPDLQPHSFAVLPPTLIGSPRWRGLSGSAIKAHLVLLSLRIAGEAVASQATVATFCGFRSQNTTAAALAQLETAGLIQRLGAEGKRTRWRVSTE